MRLASVVVTVMLVFIACRADAGPPLDATYKSLEGDMRPGRFSESWAGGGQGLTGNVVHSQSWDGTDLGLEWWVACPVLAEVPVLVEETDIGNGLTTREYRSEYTGGRFWLTGTGPWSTGEIEYTGALEYYVHHTTFLFLNGVPISYTTNADFAGHFDDWCKCILVVANAAGVGSGGQPAGYPVFKEIDEDCVDNPGLTGEWGNVADITLTIYECASSNEATNWGSIKTLYR